MTTAHVVEKSVTVNNNSPIQDYVHPDGSTYFRNTLNMECYCVYSRVLNFIVIGQYTINIPEIFQVFTVF